MITATGLGSGLDISGLVTQLVAAERAGSDLQLSRQTAKLKSKFSALGALKGSLSSFQSSLSGLNNVSNYTKKTASSSATNELTVTADSNAVDNSYSIEISQLAAQHSLASTTFADSDSTEIGTGTITIRFGNTDYDSGSDTYNSFTLNPESSVGVIEIDSSNNTLAGVMNAINQANIGVKASIINDGSGFRLLLASEATGLENSLEISVTDDDANNNDSSGLSVLSFNAAATHLQQTKAAQNSLFTVNGLAVSATSNTVDSVISGLTIVLKEASNTAIDVSVQADTSAVTDGVNSFITGYNQFINTTNTLSRYDAENDTPSALLGDFTLRSISGQISNIIRGAVDGLDGSVSSLSELGITTKSDGTLSLDSTKLNNALANNAEEVAQIFAAIGKPEDENISFNSAAADTIAGNYAVEITTLATKGAYTAAAVLPDFGGGGTLLIDSNNDNFSIEIDGVNSGVITLTPGTYTSGEALADEIQVRINSASTLKDVSLSVAVTYDSISDSFIITSNTIGSFSKVNILSVDINTSTELGFSISSGVDGVDVAGRIGGVAAIGIGDVLTADAGTDAEGLSLLISGTTIGSRGNVNFTRGLANQIDILMQQVLDEEGSLETRIDSFKSRLDDVTERKEQLEIRWAIVEERYRTQFNALDRLLAQLSSTSTYLEEQFDNFLDPYTGR